MCLVSIILSLVLSCSKSNYKKNEARAMSLKYRFLEEFSDGPKNKSEKGELVPEKETQDFFTEIGKEIQDKDEDSIELKLKNLSNSSKISPNNNNLPKNNLFYNILNWAYDIYNRRWITTKNNLENNIEIFKNYLRNVSKISISKKRTALIVTHGFNSEYKYMTGLPNKLTKLGLIKYYDIFFICRKDMCIYTYDNDINYQLTNIKKYYLPKYSANGNNIKNQAKSIEEILGILINTHEYNNIVLLSHSISANINLRGIEFFLSKNVNNNICLPNIGFISLNGVLREINFAKHLKEYTLNRHNLSGNEFDEIRLDRITVSTKNTINRIKMIMKDKFKALIIASKSEILQAFKVIASKEYDKFKPGVRALRYCLGVQKGLIDDVDLKYYEKLFDTYSYEKATDGVLCTINSLGGTLDPDQEIIYQKNKIKFLDIRNNIPSLCDFDNEHWQENVFSNIDKKNKMFILFEDLAHADIGSRISKDPRVEFLVGKKKQLEIGNYINIPSITDSEKVADCINNAIKYFGLSS